MYCNIAGKSRFLNNNSRHIRAIDEDMSDQCSEPLKDVGEGPGVPFGTGEGIRDF